MPEHHKNTYRRRGEDNYSYHGDAVPRVVGAIMNYPLERPMYRSAIAELAEVSVPTASKVVHQFIGESLLVETRHIHIGPYNRPTPELLPTEDLGPAVVANSDWQRATVIRYLMMHTRQDEGAILDQALLLLQMQMDAENHPEL